MHVLLATHVSALSLDLSQFWHILFVLWSYIPLKSFAQHLTLTSELSERWPLHHLYSFSLESCRSQINHCHDSMYLLDGEISLGASVGGALCGSSSVGLSLVSVLQNNSMGCKTAPCDNVSLLGTLAILIFNRQFRFLLVHFVPRKAQRK